MIKGINSLHKKKSYVYNEINPSSVSLSEILGKPVFLLIPIVKYLGLVFKMLSKYKNISFLSLVLVFFNF